MTGGGKMVKYILFRLFWMMLLLWAIISIIFIVSSVMMIRARNIGADNLSKELEIVMNLYRPYMQGIITRGDFGQTFEYYPRPLLEIIVPKAALTFKLNVLAFIIYLPLSFITGILLAIYKQKVVSKVVMAVLMMLGSIPHFILVFLFTIFLAVRWQLLPDQFPVGDHAFMVSVLGYVIPMMALVFPPLFIITRVVRAEFIEAFEDDYNLLLKVKGLTFGKRIYKHMIRHVLVPVLPLLVPTFLYVLMGSFFVEQIYGIPGAAKLLFESLMRPYGDTFYVHIDPYMAAAVTTFYAGFGMIFALIIDIIYHFVDPRMKIGQKKNVIG
jgi:oligopeptide transport system permease protein